MKLEQVEAHDALPFSRVLIDLKEVEKRGPAEVRRYMSKKKLAAEALLLRSAKVTEIEEFRMVLLQGCDTHPE